MASITRESNGRRVIQFVAPDKRRRSIRLGKVSQRAAEAVKFRIEQLVTAQITGHAPDDETARWLAALDSVMSDKLAAVGLAPKRPTATLAGFIDGYIASRDDVKRGTTVVYGQTRRNLVGFFGDKKPLRDITPGDADAWRLFLIGLGLADNTVRRRSGMAKQFFGAAVRRKLIGENPFIGLVAAVRGNPSRYRFITPDETGRVIDACPDAQWRLIVALSRYGGLRCPSEHLALKWSDIDWARNRIMVPSPKTEHHPGGDKRQVPLFPELLPFLREVFEAAEPGTERVITRYRTNTMNLRTQFHRIIRRAGMEPWPKPFQNLRSSRETELAETWPLHVVCSWIGNSQPVAAKHYLQVTDEHFERAVKSAEKPVQSALQNPVQHAHASACTAVNAQRPNRDSGTELDEMRVGAGECNPQKTAGMGVPGFEPGKAIANGFTARPLWPLGYTPEDYCPNLIQIRHPLAFVGGVGDGIAPPHRYRHNSPPEAVVKTARSC